MSIFPFINPETAEKASDADLPLFQEYAYDFETNELKTDRSGKTYLVSGNEALRTWIYFALLTARYRYTAHSAGYGSEIEEELLGEPLSDDIVQSELERYITESLMVNPYIEELSEFDIKADGDRAEVSFKCRTVYGEEKMQFETEGAMKWTLRRQKSLQG